jgi:hypothetical protein
MPTPPANADPTAILPFIPGGADFARSRELFRELGCVEQGDAGDLVGMGWGGARFIDLAGVCWHVS